MNREPRVCPHCHQLMPEAALAISMGRVTRRMYEAILRSGDRGLTVEQLVSATYENEPDGGPLYARAGVPVMVHKLRQLLQPHGQTVTYSPYKIISCAPVRKQRPHRRVGFLI